MSTFYETENLAAMWHGEGFVEIVVAEGKAFTREDRLAMIEKLKQMQACEVRVLIARQHSYSPPPDYPLIDIGALEDLSIAKVAYFAPTPTSQNLSHVVGITALKNTPYKVFTERGDAIAWLLE